MTPALYRPQPIFKHSARPVDQNTPPAWAAARLREGEVLLVTDRYSTGAEILSVLAAELGEPAPDASYEERRAHKQAARATAMGLLAPIDNHRLALSGGRPNGLFQELYPGQSRFFLPFAQVQELHGAWERYQNGVPVSVLGYRLHPYYGVYAPNRTEHLELFATWLAQYSGPRRRAVDVGTGSGVLALMLCRAGFSSVLATDTNPNAIESVARQVKRLPEPPPIELLHGDLFGTDRSAADLIVFNPPWQQGKVEGLLDSALVFEEGLFERFFDQALARLSPAGRIVLVFSTVLQLSRPDLPHPILGELERGRLRLVQKLNRKVRPAPTPAGQPRKTREQVEVWELERLANQLQRLALSLPSAIG